VIKDFNVATIEGKRMAVYKRYKGKKVVRGSKDYDKGTWIAEGTVGGTRYHRSLKSATNKAEAEEEEDSIITKIREGEFDLLRDKTKLGEFIDEIYLPYCRVKNPN
jgi:hypothetical protein